MVSKELILLCWIIDISIQQIESVFYVVVQDKSKPQTISQSLYLHTVDETSFDRTYTAWYWMYKKVIKIIIARFLEESHDDVLYSKTSNILNHIVRNNC